MSRKRKKGSRRPKANRPSKKVVRVYVLGDTDPDSPQADGSEVPDYIKRILANIENDSKKGGTVRHVVPETTKPQA